MDRRVDRTQRALRAALLDLVQERGWDAVSIRDICERADVGRSTFYVHFARKDDLLVSGFNELATKLGGQCDGRLGFLRGLIDHALENRRLFRALVGKKAGEMAERNFRYFVSKMINRDLASVNSDGGADKARIVFISGGISALLIASLEGRVRPDAAALEHSCRQLAERVWLSKG
jgi:AcrR family transcriptional regulator